MSLSEFERLDIRVGCVSACERIQGRQKLFRLRVNIGTSEIQVVAGGGETYQPEYFVGKNFVVLTNLEPKIIAGNESKGMLLAADHRGEPIWLTVPDHIPAGTKVR
ncbi:tRNA-binding protein [Candidatus Bathyarchaeota archaeon]|nr:tRNA-binding protein [Candidatus Bathyarchaeota archaeon]